MKLLLVDANETYAHHLRGELLRSGAMLCDLELATSFSDATEQLGRARFDAILIDPSSLPDVPRCAFGELQAFAQRAPILVFSDEYDDALAIDAVREGAHDVLIKSNVQPDWLLRRVRYAIDRQRGETARTRLTGPHTAQRSQTQALQFAHMTEVQTRQNEFVAANSPATYAEATSTVEFYRDEVFDDENTKNQSLGEGRPTNTAPGPAGWRVLHIENDPVFLTLADKLLRCDSPHPLAVTHASTIAEAAESLKATAYDAVLLDLSLPGNSGLDILTTILQQAGEAPVLVITANDEAATAVDAMRRGAEDFLRKSEPDLRYLRRATQLAIVRRDRALQIPPPPDVASTSEAAKPASVNAPERRRHARYLLTKPIFATPVLPDGSPAATYSADGFSVDVSEGGLRFEIGNLPRLPTTHLLVGIEGLDTVLYFATVEARHVVRKGNGLDVGAQFAKGARDLIRKENLEPTFNPSTARFETGLPNDVIMKWVDFGIFRPALFDRQFVCPQCHAIPTFRNGCRVCGSVRLHSRPLIHHFACAHVGYVSDFEQNGSVICPKCRTRNLIVGADFEHLNGPYHCLDCDWSDTDLDTVGQCMKCELRFPMAQAIEEDLIGYHVNRLDPLAFINAG